VASRLAKSMLSLPECAVAEPVTAQPHLSAGRHEGVLAMQARHCATDSVDGRSVSFIIDTSSPRPPTETSASRKPTLAASRSLRGVAKLGPLLPKQDVPSYGCK